MHVQDASLRSVSLPQTAGELLRSRAALMGDKTAVIHGESSISYTELDARSERLGAALLILGLRPGDSVLFQLGTNIETLLALFGCFKAGLIPVCTLPQHRRLEIDAISAVVKPRAHIVQADYSSNFDLVSFAEDAALRDGSNRIVIQTRGERGRAISLDRLIESCPSGRTQRVLTDVSILPDDRVMLQLSGGSTGTPKIIPRGHREYLLQADGMACRHRLTMDDVTLWPLPLIHNAALVLIVFPTLLRGATMVLQNRFEVGDFLDAIERHGVSYAGSVGPVAPSLMRTEGCLHEKTRSLRMFFALDGARALQDRLGCPVTNLYGITEGLLMSCSPADPPDIRFDTVGYPTTDTDDIALIDAVLEQRLEGEAVGELCFRGPHLFQGYVGSPNRSDLTADGFFRTGDLFRRVIRDGRPSYAFIERMKDNISRGGEKFAANEVESLAVRHPAVLDARVVAFPDVLLGERACMFVIVRPGHELPSRGDLSAFFDELGLARYKHPERIIQIPDFPVTHVGKVDKSHLRRLAAEYVTTSA